jgi:hypothetical protein
MTTSMPLGDSLQGLKTSGSILDMYCGVSDAAIVQDLFSTAQNQKVYYTGGESNPRPTGCKPVVITN